jgi:hypothetical protein
MQFEHAPAGRAFPGHLTSATDRALDLALHGGQGTPNGDLNHELRKLCREAQGQGVRAEELILLFKKVWATRPELRVMSREETGRVFDEVVTLCLDAYYEDTR